MKAKPGAVSVLTVLGIGLGLLASCVSGNGRNDQIVDGLRILGVRSEVKGAADLADADIGDTVILSALVIPPKDVPTVTVTWLACLRADAQTAVPCTDQGVLRDPLSLIGMAGVLNLGTGTSIEATIPEEARPMLEAVLARADTQTSAECTLFVETPLIVIAQASNGTVITASKTLRLSPYHALRTSSDPAYHYLPNTNPAIDGLFLNPTSRDACAGLSAVVSCAQDSDCAGTGCVNGTCLFPEGDQVVCGHIPDTGELIARCGLDGVIESKPEQLSVSWYATGGSVGAVTSAMGMADDLASGTFMSFTRPPGPFTIWGVARDGRAGEAWIVQDFQ